MKRLRHLIEYLIMRSLVALCALPSRNFRRKMGRLLGVAVRTVGIRKNVVAENIKLAFPEVSADDRAILERKTFEHFGEVIVDTSNISAWTEEDIRNSTTLLAEEKLRKILDRGKGAIIATAHFGCYEVFAVKLGMEGYKLTVLYKEVHNKYIDEYVKRIRTMGGTKVVKSGIQLRQVIKALKANECVGILADQDAGENGLFLPFFGRDASTLPGPADLALLTGAGLLTAFCPVVQGKYRLEFEDEIERTNRDEMMLEYNRRVERIVRTYPDQYFWLHRRWKSAR